MVKKTITYLDFNDEERTEDFYFNFTKAEVTEMEAEYKGGLVAKLQAIVAENDNKEIIRMLKELILKAYGEKSPDGKRFIKTQEIRDSLEQSNAYSELFISLASDADLASEFFRGVIPKVPEDKHITQEKQEMINHYKNVLNNNLEPNS